MERLIDALVLLVSRKPPGTSREIRVELGSAPASVTALANAMATHAYYVELGEFSMFEDGETGVIVSLAEQIRWAAREGRIDLDAVLQRAPLDPERTLALAADGGGMSMLGVCWGCGTPALFVVELEDPTEASLLTRFATPQEVFAFIDARNLRHGGDVFPDLEALRAVGRA